MTSPKQNIQYAPWPTELEAAVLDFRYLEKWRFWLSDEPRDYVDVARTIPVAGGLTLNILVPCFDTYHMENYRPVHHTHQVPAATYNRASWEDWLLECLLKTLTHEAVEHARFEENIAPSIPIGAADTVYLKPRRPWVPTHGPGDNPYVVRHYASARQRRTSFRGELNPE